MLNCTGLDSLGGRHHFKTKPPLGVLAGFDRTQSQVFHDNRQWILRMSISIKHRRLNRKPAILCIQQHCCGSNLSKRPEQAFGGARIVFILICWRLCLSSPKKKKYFADTLLSSTRTTAANREVRREGKISHYWFWAVICSRNLLIKRHWHSAASFTLDWLLALMMLDA